MLRNFNISVTIEGERKSPLIKGLFLICINPAAEMPMLI